jgi:Uma2 family endonuclease
MGATTTHLMSFVKFAKLPEPASCRYELRHGELVQVPPPKLDHHLIQDRIAELLKPIARNSGHVSMELLFAGFPSMNTGSRMRRTYPAPG